MMRALLLATAMLLPVAATAADISLIVGGWSHHFVPTAERDSLNQNQGTAGLELSTLEWDLQVSHMTDSFGCSSNQAAVAKRWELAQYGSWFHAGAMLGAVAAHRCTDGGHDVQVTTYEYEPVTSDPPTGTSKCVSDPYKFPYTFCLYQVINNEFQEPSPKWVYGVLPGLYATFGDTVNFQVTLLRSPWTGHHLVLYGQLSVKVFSF